MPGEDQLIKGRQELDAGLKDIYAVFNNYLTTTVIPVEKGDTLWNLAVKFLGDGQRWREIYFLNLDRLQIAWDKHHATMSPNLIYSGDNIRIFSF